MTLLLRRVSAGETYSANSGYLHGDSDGMPPVATHQLIMTLMLPRMLYRLDSVILIQTDVQNQDTHHSKILHNLPFLTEKVARTAIHLLFRLLPVEAEIHVRVLTPQGNHIPICHKPRYYLDKYEGREMLHAGLSKLKHLVHTVTVSYWAGNCGLLLVVCAGACMTDILNSFYREWLLQEGGNNQPSCWQGDPYFPCQPSMP